MLGCKKKGVGPHSSTTKAVSPMGFTCGCGRLSKFAVLVIWDSVYNVEGPYDFCYLHEDQEKGHSH